LHKPELDDCRVPIGYHNQAHLNVGAASKTLILDEPPLCWWTGVRRVLLSLHCKVLIGYISSDLSLSREKSTTVYGYKLLRQQVSGTWFTWGVHCNAEREDDRALHETWQLDSETVM
jgi:hypothetical protein